MDTPERPGNDVEPIWLITANAVEERDYGPGGEEKRKGTKHFRGGAKVYIVRWHSGGMGESVVVIGHHRANGRYVQLHVRKRHLENLRMTLCYSRKVIKMVTEEWEFDLPDKAQWERYLALLEAQ